MSLPIRIHYRGHAHPTALPLLADPSAASNWWRALAYVNKFVAPCGPSFTLFDGRWTVRYRNGAPHQADLVHLLAALRAERAERPEASPPRSLAA